MQVTEEQLKVFPKEDRAWVRETLAKQRNPKAIALKQEIHDWAYEKYGKVGFSWSQILNSVNVAIKLKLGLKEIRKLTDEQVPEAREAFEKYKEDFDI